MPETYWKNQKIPLFCSNILYSFHISEMGYFGLDLGGNYIKVCCWNNDRSSSVGIGPEIVDNDRTQRMSLYHLFIQTNTIEHVLVLKVLRITFAVSVVKLLLFIGAF